MPLQLGALYQALLNPGNTDLAQKAAEEVAGYETRMAAIDTKLSVLTAMVGSLIGLVLLVLSKVW